MEKIQFLREMIKVTILKKYIPKTDEDEREFKYEGLIDFEIEILDQMQHSREDIKNILERLDKMFHFDDDETEWTITRGDMSEKIKTNR